MYKTIIIGVAAHDDMGADALHLAQQLASSGAEFIGLCVTTDAGQETGAATDTVRHFALAHPGVEVDVQIASTAAKGLHDAAVRHRADLIVVGSSHRGQLGRIFAGDDAAATMRGAPCAVAIAPKGYAQSTAPLARIGVGYDGGDSAAAALARAEQIAGTLSASVHVLGVVEIPGGGASLGYYGGGIDDQVAEMHHTLADLPVAGRTVVVGLATTELVRWAESVDLLMLGSPHHGLAERVFFGSSADALAVRSPRPLLLIPPAVASPEVAEAKLSAIPAP